MLSNHNLNSVVSAEEERVLPWHFPMTEPKSSLTDLRKKRFREGWKTEKKCWHAALEPQMTRYKMVYESNW